jgi:thiol-disulfide isomerase/thioredoxin
MRRLFCAAWLALAVPAQAATAESARSLEAALVHRRPSLRDIEVWSRQTGAWHPLALPRGKVLVVNLWSRSCVPCLKELPVLARMVNSWKPNQEVQFLFVADGPTEMTRDKVEDFWLHPWIDLPGQQCPGQSARVLSSSTRCVLEVPEQDPARTTSERLADDLNSHLKPVTLLIDPRGTVRQAFVGELSDRTREFSQALERLLAALAAERGEAPPKPRHERHDQSPRMQ